MNNDKTRNDFIFFQNEILGDVKKIESKLMEKMSQTVSFVETQSEKYDNKLKDLTNKYDIISKEINEHNKIKKYEEMHQLFQRKIEELISRIEIKLNILEKDFRDTRFKYDTIISNNLLVPGLIGNSCPYINLRPFLEYTNQKIYELSKSRDKHAIDYKKYKEKLEILISQNNTQFEIAEKKFSDFCNEGFDQCDKICKDRMNIIEKRIESLRIENGKYAYELKKKAEEIQIDWERLNKIENTINKKYKEEWNKYSEFVDIINNKFDKNNNEFYLIKKKFTELSEFIKDIRFRNNLKKLGEKNQDEFKKERKKYNEISEKIDFCKIDKGKKLENIIKKDKDENKIKTNEEDNKEEKEDNNDNNTEKIYNERKNEIKSKKIENNNEKLKINDTNNKRIIQNKFIKEKTLSLSEINLDNKNLKEMLSNNSDFQRNSINVTSNNIFEVISNKDKKNLRKKSIEFGRINNDNNTYNYNNDRITYQIINYNRNLNDSKDKNNPDNEIKNDNININNNNNQKTMKENNEQNLMFLVENAKINNLILGADFNGNSFNNVNSPTYNLSQAYMIIKKKRNEEMQKMRRTSLGKTEQKYNKISPSLSSLNHSRNLNNNNSGSFNRSYSKNDFKNSNKEDLYYSTIKNDKIKKIQNKNININLSNQENYNNLPKKYPKIIKDKNENNHNMIELNTINVNNNLFNNSKSLIRKNKSIISIQKKMINSSSDKELLIKYSPFSPIFKDRFLKNNKNSEETNQFKYNLEVNAKETLNHINPYLIQKFKNA